MLLVDDLADSGVTLAAVAERLRGLPAISELRSAVLWTKAISTYTPDYFVEVLPTSPWIHQPFEDYDGISHRDADQAQRRGVTARGRAPVSRHRAADDSAGHERPDAVVLVHRSEIRHAIGFTSSPARPNVSKARAGTASPRPTTTCRSDLQSCSTFAGSR